MKAFKEDYRMNDKELLLEAIDNYDVLTPQGRDILRTLVIAAKDDNTVNITIKNLYELSKVSKQGAYNTLQNLEKSQFIERVKVIGNRISLFKLNATKLEEVIEYYKTIKHTKNILRKL